MLADFLHNFAHNLFKPLLLFFYMGFLIPILKVPFEFPKAVYQGLTLYLLVAIGWHGGEELASLSLAEFGQALGFMGIGFVTNLCIGLFAYFILQRTTKLRQVDAATVAGFYGSDSAGTFVTCLGVIAAANIAYAAYMPVMLAVMEIPGCLVALFLVSRLRQKGMDPHGNMPYEPGFQPATQPALEMAGGEAVEYSEELQGESLSQGNAYPSHGHTATAVVDLPQTGTKRQLAAELDVADDLEIESDEEEPSKKEPIFSKELLHEVFLNPGLYLLFGGIVIGFLGRLQGEAVTRADDTLFVNIFHGMLCLFLLEMGITACRRLKDLKTAGWRFILFGVLAPNVFAFVGIVVAHGYSIVLGQPFGLGTYALFAVLCGAASYIAVPAVQRLAIPEASPTLPLAASLGLTFTYNVTIGIPVYMLMAQSIMTAFPVT
ncbi:sodium-dependent bicarbonate transport family permease [uncultured Gimesia sp.]|uniref:sodium-dependent bicarbonate transport family permease n=1 Tax=uncultured Gimesia sp. TaxID=1678688 RepID=UPI0030DA1BC7|tara:strand:+ start:43865 stop:45163 length:1299 start_codon:yes stop_codon:yes gene_type:complete